VRLDTERAEADELAAHVARSSGGTGGMSLAEMQARLDALSADPQMSDGEQEPEQLAEAARRAVAVATVPAVEAADASRAVILEMLDRATGLVVQLSESMEARKQLRNASWGLDAHGNKAGARAARGAPSIDTPLVRTRQLPRSTDKHARALN
jgi:hypothetical protein